MLKKVNQCDIIIGNTAKRRCEPEMNNCLIYDDNKFSCEKLKQLLCDNLNDKNILIYTAVNKIQACNALKNSISVLFIDIELENRENGIEFAQLAKKIYPEIKIVFITAYQKYCEEIFFETDPVGFLVKPFTSEKVEKIISKLKKLNINEQDDFIIISITKSNTRKVSLKNVVYIESAERKLFFRDISGNELCSFKIKLSAIEDQLPPYFLRCHNSICIDMNFISDIHRYYFTLKNEITLPISQRRFKEANDRFIKFLGGE